MLLNERYLGRWFPMSQRQVCINTHVPLEGSSSPRSRTVANGPACKRGARDRHHRIRSHDEQVETNVINKLSPRDRKEKPQLSAERAQKGRRVWRGRRCLHASLRSAIVRIPTISRVQTLHWMPAAFSQAGRKSLRCRTRSVAINSGSGPCATAAPIRMQRFFRFCYARL
jgi:hypothetical protein